MTNPNAHESLSRRIAEAVLHPLDHPTDIASESLAIVTGLADLLACHADQGAFHGHSIDPAQIRSAAAAIHRECRLLGALVEHIAEEARTLRRLTEAGMEVQS